MALIEDVFKGNLATGLAIGAGALLLGPTLIQAVGSVLRPAAKAAIKGGMVFCRETLSEIGKWQATSSPKRKPSWRRRPAPMPLRGAVNRPSERRLKSGLATANRSQSTPAAEQGPDDGSGGMLQDGVEQRGCHWHARDEHRGTGGDGLLPRPIRASCPKHNPGPRSASQRRLERELRLVKGDRQAAGSRICRGALHRWDSADIGLGFGSPVPVPQLGDLQPQSTRDEMNVLEHGESGQQFRPDSTAVFQHDDGDGEFNGQAKLSS